MDPLENLNSQVKRLTALSKNVNDAINEILSMAHAQAQIPGPVNSGGSEPDIRLVEKNLWINRIMIPLGSRQKTLMLIRAFFRAEHLTLSKAEIVSSVYGVQENYSPRYVEAQDINLTKLLSRTRTFLEESLAHTYQTPPLDWLAFDVKTRKYRLYRLRTEFLEVQKV